MFLLVLVFTRFICLLFAAYVCQVAPAFEILPSAHLKANSNKKLFVFDYLFDLYMCVYISVLCVSSEINFTTGQFQL